MKKRIGLLILFGIVAPVIAMMGATSVLAAEPIIPSVVLEVAVADEGVAVGSLSLATVEEGAAMAPLLSSTVEGQAIAISMTTRADIGASQGTNAPMNLAVLTLMVLVLAITLTTYRGLRLYLAEHLGRGITSNLPGLNMAFGLRKLASGDSIACG